MRRAKARATLLVLAALTLLPLCPMVVTEIESKVLLHRLEEKILPEGGRVVGAAGEIRSNHGRCALLSGLALTAPISPDEVARFYEKGDPQGLFLAWREADDVVVLPIGLHAIHVKEPLALPELGADLGPLLTRLLGSSQGTAPPLVLVHVVERRALLDFRCY